MTTEEQIAAAEDVMDLMASDGMLEEGVSGLELLDAMACCGVMLIKGRQASDAYIKVISRPEEVA